MICPKCNFNNVEGASFCGACGTSLKGINASQITPVQTEEKTPVIDPVTVMQPDNKPPKAEQASEQKTPDTPKAEQANEQKTSDTPKAEQASEQKTPDTPKAEQASEQKTSDVPKQQEKSAENDAGDDSTSILTSNMSNFKPAPKPNVPPMPQQVQPQVNQNVPPMPQPMQPQGNVPPMPQQVQPQVNQNVPPMPQQVQPQVNQNVPPMPQQVQPQGKQNVPPMPQQVPPQGKQNVPPMPQQVQPQGKQNVPPMQPQGQSVPPQRKPQNMPSQPPAKQKSGKGGKIYIAVSAIAMAVMLGVIVFGYIHFSGKLDDRDKENADIIASANDAEKAYKSEIETLNSTLSSANETYELQISELEGEVSDLEANVSQLKTDLEQAQKDADKYSSELNEKNENNKKYDGLIKYANTHAAQGSETFFCSDSVLHLKVGDKASLVRVYFLAPVGELYTLTYNATDGQVADCKWWQSEDEILDENRVHPLYITPKKEGSTTITLTNSVTNDKLTIYVVVEK